MSTTLRTHTISQCEELIGMEALQSLLDTFSCPLNAEVETFLKNKALQSSRLSSSQTYLVLDETTKDLLGYYTLLLKAYVVNGTQLSANNRRLMSRFAEVDKEGNFIVAVYLIAQIGKNLALPKPNRISGDILLSLAVDEFNQIKKRVGGKLVMLEREKDRDKLKSFYQNNGFKSWTQRISPNENVIYDQMFAVL